MRSAYSRTMRLAEKRGPFVRRVALTICQPSVEAPRSSRSWNSGTTSARADRTAHRRGAGPVPPHRLRPCRRSPTRSSRRTPRPTSRRARDRLRTPLSAAFIPLVPLASFGGRGRFTQTSQPGHQWAGEREVVVLEERDPICDLGCALQLEQRRGRSPWRHRRRGCALPGEHELHRAVTAEQAECAVGPQREQVEPLVGREAAGEADRSARRDRSRAAAAST